MTTKKNSKLQGYLLIAVFVVPLFIAMGMYFMRDGMHAVKSVSHGELIYPAQPVTRIQIESGENSRIDLETLKGKWTYLVYSPQACDLECEASLFKLRQTKKATGREANRVQSALLIKAGQLETEIQNRNPRTLMGELIKMELENGDRASLKLEPGKIYLMDPHGNLMMKYDQSSTSRGMLKDIKKLLKISNIG